MSRNGLRSWGWFPSGAFEDVAWDDTSRGEILSVGSNIIPELKFNDLYFRCNCVLGRRRRGEFAGLNPCEIR